MEAYRPPSSLKRQQRRSGLSSESSFLQSVEKDILSSPASANGP